MAIMSIFFKKNFINFRKLWNRIFKQKLNWIEFQSGIFALEWSQNKTKKKFSISRSTNTNKQGGVLACLLQSSKSDFFFASKWWWWFDWFEADGYHYFLIWFDPHDSMGVLLIQWMDVFCKKKKHLALLPTHTYLKLGIKLTYFGFGFLENKNMANSEWIKFFSFSISTLVAHV